MNEKLAIVLEQIGADGITAFYVYLALEFITVWVFFGLLIIAGRAVWKRIKDNF